MKCDVLLDASSAAARVVEACTLAIDCGSTDALAASVIETLDDGVREMVLARNELARLIGWPPVDGCKATICFGRWKADATDRGGKTKGKPASHG